MSENSIPPTGERADIYANLPTEGCFQSPLIRFAVVAATIFVAIYITGMLRDSENFMWLIGFPLFPLGLAVYFPGNVNLDTSLSLSLVGGWLIYLGLAIGMMFSRKTWLVIALYVVLIALLVMNVQGCRAVGLWRSML